MTRAWCLVLLVAACGQDTVRASKADTGNDYGHTALAAAVDKFVAAKRTPDAYAELAQTVATLRPTMDRAVAEEAELKLLVLALAPVQAAKDAPLDHRVAALARTVWPTLLGPKIEADAILQVRDPKAPLYPPKPGEDAAAYLQRLCGSVLAADCKHVVPEYQGAVVEALALRRALERVRNSVADCLACSTDPGWQQAVVGWEMLDRAAAEPIGETERIADPSNWPVAGAAADDDLDVPEAEITRRGEIAVDGHSYGPNAQRIAVLRELRGKSGIIALHLHPEFTLAETRGVVADARKAGAQRVAVIAREPVYPWARHVYWLAEGSGLRVDLRASDSLQLLLHAIDEVAGPGTVARVD